MDPVPPIGAPGVTPPSGSQPPSTPTVSGLALLPPEIFITIISLFCANCQDPTYEHESDNPKKIREGLATLSALSKTCTCMRGVLAQPILHHSFAPISNFTLPAQLYCFVRTLLDRQDLSNAVQVLSLDSHQLFEYNPSDKPGRDRLRFLVRLCEVKRVEQAASDASLSEWEFYDLLLRNRNPASAYNTWEWGHADGCIDLDFEACEILAQLAISLCPNVKVVSFGQFARCYDSQLFQQATAPFGSAHHNNVEIVQVRDEHYPAWHNLKTVSGRHNKQ